MRSAQIKLPDPVDCLAGNAFSAELPVWVPLKQVKFLYVQSFLDTWWPQISEAFVGLVLLVGLINSTGHGMPSCRVREYFTHFSAEGPVETLQWTCAKVLGIWGVGTMAVALPVYGLGSNYYGAPPYALCISIN